MADTDDHGRTDPPLAGDEAATLIGFLDYHRDTLAWKTAGLDAAGLSTTVGASDMTLGGILKHLALVEDDWFGCCLLGRPPSAPWTDVDWKQTGTGTGTVPPKTARTSCEHSGRPRSTSPDAISPLPRRPAASTSSPPGPGRTDGLPACAGSWST